jgi:hypothetical protein
MNKIIRIDLAYTYHYKAFPLLSGAEPACNYYIPRNSMTNFSMEKTRNTRSVEMILLKTLLKKRHIYFWNNNCDVDWHMPIRPATEPESRTSRFV